MANLELSTTMEGAKKVPTAKDEMNAYDNNNNNYNHTTNTTTTATMNGSVADSFIVSDDEDSTYKQPSSVTSTEKNTTGEFESGVGRMARRETRLVTCSKVLVCIVLFIAALLCGGFTFFFTRRSEVNDFEGRFEDYGEELVKVSQIAATNILSAMFGMSTTITSNALDKNLTWPFVTIPHYDRRASPINKISASRHLSLAILVKPELREEWEKWSVENQGWIPREEKKEQDNDNNNTSLINPYITKRTDDGQRVREDRLPMEYGQDYYFVLWQNFPVRPSSINWNMIDLTQFLEAYEVMEESRSMTLSGLTNYGTNATPACRLMTPVFDDFTDNATIVATFASSLHWHQFFTNVLPDGASLHVVVENTCNQSVTYEINGSNVTFVGEGDLHHSRFDDLEILADFESLNNNNNSKSCIFSLRVYPTKKFENSFLTKGPIWYTIGVVLIFVITSSVFLLYDWLVQRRQDKVMTSAERTNAIVSSLFPVQVRDRLLVEQGEVVGFGGGNNRRNSKNKELYPFSSAHNNNAGSLLTSTRCSNATALLAGMDDDVKSRLLRSKPIADLFPHATVMFGDICGFTAWSSVREPAQVFTLLEQIYQSFDTIARKRRIFKVETIGDCYVAAAGLPEARDDHGEVMAKFAHECRLKMNQVVKQLEVILGPDTADLSMRFGLHSGPVTAGVLRGEKSRFQLFGDTVNTASRIESTGKCNMIHLSQETADILIASGRSKWVVPRDEMVEAKGKGRIQTYWLTMKDTNGRSKHRLACSADTCSNTSETSSSSTTPGVATSPHRNNTTSNLVQKAKALREERIERLIDWNVDVLHRHLQKIVAMRDKKKLEEAKTAGDLRIHIPKEGRTVLDEVKEIISLPSEVRDYIEDPDHIELRPEVMVQLKDYVVAIASMYRNNSFHCFEHASHVTQSVTKLLARVVTPDARISYDDNMGYNKNDTKPKNRKRKDSHDGLVVPTDNTLHEYTYGITSDPLTQFACAFSALIHDVDHTGVPNATLVSEESDLAKMYRNKSVAEQNSVDLAWELLMEPSYTELRQCIYANQEELQRFRELVVNSVMATDIVDKELGALRKKRWEKAFIKVEKNLSASPSTQDLSSFMQFASSSFTTSSSSFSSLARIDSNRKATIVIEHIIQASDVSHTMQHWHVYQKWNEKLFHEMYKAYLMGRSSTDPSKFWYQGELNFFDFYIIPLAKKLKECGVFSVASDEYLNYAKTNRQEWEIKGKDVVKGYIAKYYRRPSSLGRNPPTPMS